MRWIALHLPLLSLESFAAQRLSATGAADSDSDSDSKVTDAPPIVLLSAHRVALCNAAAQALGVQLGFKRATAVALVPHLLIGQVDAARDAQALLAVGHAALAYTPAVTLAPPRAVLLEVQASLRYFGGLPALLRRLLSDLQPLGHQLHWASAPTAHGALLLARWGPSLREGAGAVPPVVPVPPARPVPSRAKPVHVTDTDTTATTDNKENKENRENNAHTEAAQPFPPGGTHCADLAALAHTLAHAPLAVLDAAAPHADALRAMGLHTLGDVLPLPRAGLARRFGPALLSDIDRALGAQPEPQAWLVWPEVFAERLDLMARADSTAQVLHAAQMLLARLVAWAAARHALVRRFTLHLQHEPRRHRREHDSTPDATPLDIALAEPSRDPAHLALLLRERLAHLPLPAPTLALRLHCDDLSLQAPPHGELFPTPRSEREGVLRLIERLQARLGAERIQRLQRVDEHRPERASRCLPTQAAEVGAQAERWARVAAAAASPASTRPRPTAGMRPVPPLSAEATPAASASPRPNAAPVRHVSPAAIPSVPLGPRPLWLLPAPQPLATQRSGAPLWQGRPLHLLCGPERIEAGWWDAALAERDYHVAQAHDGALVWLYRERLPAALRTSAALDGGSDHASGGASEGAPDGACNAVSEGVAEAAAGPASPRAGHDGWYLHGLFA